MKIRIYTAFFGLYVLFFGLMSPEPANAATVFGDGCKGDTGAVCSQVTSAPASTNKFIKDIISTLLFALGVIAVIMIIVGGIRYATSDGDSAKVKSAKDTILYAVVGLVVALMAYAIVGFVLNQFKP